MVKKRPFFPLKLKEHSDQEEKGVFWPFELLSRRPELARVRILSWGYDSHINNFFSANNQQNISRHGNDLMVALEQERKGDVRAIFPLALDVAVELMRH
jgi:hypothetical protein